MKNRLKIFIALLFFLCILGINNCTSNKAYRTDPKKICVDNNCTSALIEEHKEKNEDYALTFIEFSERGNLFSRDNFDEVLSYIKKEEQKGKENDNGVMVIVYAHGWKHNASNETGDVNKFRKALKHISQVNKQSGMSDRKVIGVYLGWRGLSLDVPLINGLTYWGRKSVARQVGTGGVSEVLVRLNKIVYQKEDFRNVFVIAGHSFGGAVVLSAMKDILIYHLGNTEKLTGNACNATPRAFKKVCQEGCFKTQAFADSIVLLNPAVEANEMLQLKEMVQEERCYAPTQPKLLHILSSSSDKATNWLFPLGQVLGVTLQEKETSLKRRIYETNKQTMKDIVLSEHELDTSALGNYPIFYTGEYHLNEMNRTETIYTPNYKREFQEKFSTNFATSPFEPISMIHVGEKEIADHNDISNDFVLAYLTSAVVENQVKKSEEMKRRMPFCMNESRFDFGQCFKILKNIYERKNFDKKNK